MYKAKIYAFVSSSLLDGCESPTNIFVIMLDIGTAKKMSQPGCHRPRKKPMYKYPTAHSVDTMLETKPTGSFFLVAISAIIDTTGMTRNTSHVGCQMCCVKPMNKKVKAARTDTSPTMEPAILFLLSKMIPSKIQFTALLYYGSKVNAITIPIPHRTL